MERGVFDGAKALLLAQDGVAHAPAGGAGLTDGVIRQRIATGERERLAHGIVGVASTQRTWRRDVRVATLVAGRHAVVSHATAARLYDLDGYSTDARLVLTGTAGHRIRSSPGVEVHRCERLLPRHRIRHAGLPCAIRPVVLMQIGVVDGHDAAARALDGMLRDGDRPGWMRQVVNEWRGDGVSGPSMLLDLLHERIDARLPLSWFQRLAKRCLATHGMIVADEFPVYDAHGRRRASLDLAIPEMRIGIECQSWAWHGTPRARIADADRKRRLRLLGWELVEVSVERPRSNGCRRGRDQRPRRSPGRPVAVVRARAWNSGQPLSSTTPTAPSSP